MPGWLARPCGHRLTDVPTSVKLSVCALDACTGTVLEFAGAEQVRPIDMAGTTLLLIEVAVRLADGRLAPTNPLTRGHLDAVSGAGLTQYLNAQALLPADLATLVGALGDKLATNILLRTVGLPSVAQRAHTLDLKHLRLHDRVRDIRRPSDPPTLASGTAAELADLMARLHRGEVRSKAVSRQVINWLSRNVDTSLAAGAFGLDPLAHAEADRGMTLAHLTAAADGLRVDTGVLTGTKRAVAYAVIAEFRDSDRDTALGKVFTIGQRIRALANN